MTWWGMNLIKIEDAADWGTRYWPLDFPTLRGLTSPSQRQRSTDVPGSLSPLTWEEGLPTVSSGAFPPAGQYYNQFPRLAKCIFKRSSESCPHEVTQKTDRFYLLREGRPNEIIKETNVRNFNFCWSPQIVTLSGDFILFHTFPSTCAFLCNIWEGFI